ncbi:MAG: endolytic transglycosylase MltG [Gammaproteobacteria bacterium]
MKKIIVGLGLLVIVLPAVAFYLYRDLQQAMHEPLQINTPRTLMIEPGSSLSAIAQGLQRRDWIEYADYFVFYARLRGVAGAIKSGEYQISPGMTAAALLDMLVAGQVVQHSLTLIEGWTFQEIMQALRQQPAIRQTLASAEPRAVMAAIGKPGYFAEGRFYPDTYYFPTGATDIEFLSRANDRLQDILQEEWQRRADDLPYSSAYEALIVASIIEKETAVAAERTAIAGVFVRRLQKGMRLQTDPTVIYALGMAFDGDLKYRDMAFDSPYNTYVHAGLPPTPIAAAGRESIRAALHPAPGEALYFVARGDGSHQFSATLQEHNVAVKKYQTRK